MKRILGIVPFVVVGPILGAGGVVAAAQFFSLPIGSPKTAAAEEPKAPAQKADAHAPAGVMVPMRERIVNLADPGILRYLKSTIVLEVSDPEGHGAKADDHAKPKKGEEMPKDLRPKTPVIEDHITAVLTARTAAEIMTPQGKQQLKDDLKSTLNKALHDERVLAVYFTEFIIQ